MSTSATPTASGATNDAPVRSVRTTPSGLTIQTVEHGDVSVTTYGTDSPRIDLKQVSTGESPNEASITAHVDESRARVPGFTVPPTVYEMTLASGHFTPEEACRFAQGMDDYGCRTAAEVTRDLETTAPSGRAAAARRKIYDARCFDFRTTKGDGEKLSHNCNVRHVDSKTKRYVYVANRMKSTGWENDTGTAADGISGVGFRVDYKHSSATAVDWDPSRTTLSKCRDETVSVQGRKGASYSSSSTICEDRLTGWHSPAYQYFGSKWTGPEADRGDERDTIAASLVRIPRRGTRVYSVNMWLRWN